MQVRGYDGTQCLMYSVTPPSVRRKCSKLFQTGSLTQYTEDIKAISPKRDIYWILNPFLYAEIHEAAILGTMIDANESLTTAPHGRLAADYQLYIVINASLSGGQSKFTLIGGPLPSASHTVRHHEATSLTVIVLCTLSVAGSEQDINV